MLFKDLSIFSSMASDLALHGLPMSYNKVAWLIWFMHCITTIPVIFLSL